MISFFIAVWRAASQRVKKEYAQRVSIRSGVKAFFMHSVRCYFSPVTGAIEGARQFSGRATKKSDESV